MKNSKVTTVFPIIVLLLCLLLSGCQNAPQNQAAQITAVRQPNGQSTGVITCSSLKAHTDAFINNPKKQYYDHVPDIALAAEQKEIAAFLIHEPVARARFAENTAVTYLPNLLTDNSYAAASSTSTDRPQNILVSLVYKFGRSFIQGNRWQMVLSGLWVTLLISILSALFGTLFGFCLFLVRRSSYHIAAKLAAVFIHLIQGIPVIVLLMLLYYVVFTNPSTNGIFVAVVGFSINFGVYVSEMIRTGFSAVDTGQREAAAALGFGRMKTFTKIIAPQAARHVMPVYKSGFISMVKMTSVVGYIAIQDLTKVGDIIRSHTHDALFPLLATAIIYFLLVWGLTLLLGVIETNFDPKHRRNILKGIQTDIRFTEQPMVAVLSPSAKPVIAVSGLKKEYQNITPISNVNAQIYGGKVISIIGPSGTGKSTLLRCLNRLETPTNGEIQVLGQNMSNAKTAQLNAARRKMGMVFQNSNLFPHLTVIENIMLAPVEILGNARQAAYERGMQLLQSVGLAEKAANYPDQLSRGQKQRAAIARTLAMQPQIVLFDEPTTALDPTMAGEVLAVLRSLAQKGLTMLIVTHEMKFAKDVSTRVFYMDEGVIYEAGTPQQIFDAPKTEKCRAFVRQLKTYHACIASKSFDFIRISAELDTFARKHLLSARQLLKFQQIFEGLCISMILHSLPERGWVLTFDAACSEDGSQCACVLRWDGIPFNPLAQADELSVILAISETESSKYNYQDTCNSITIQF